MSLTCIGWKKNPLFMCLLLQSTVPAPPRPPRSEGCKRRREQLCFIFFSMSQLKEGGGSGRGCVCGATRRGVETGPAAVSWRPGAPLCVVSQTPWGSSDGRASRSRSGTGAGRAPRSQDSVACASLCGAGCGASRACSSPAEGNICLGDGSARTISIFPLLWAFSAVPASGRGCIIERWLKSRKMESM